MSTLVDRDDLSSSIQAFMEIGPDVTGDRAAPEAFSRQQAVKMADRPAAHFDSVDRP